MSLPITLDLEAYYENVVSENVIRDAQRLLREAAPGTSLTRSYLAPRQPRLLDLEGLGADIWQGIDPKQYIDELRNEWDTRRTDQV